MTSTEAEALPEVGARIIHCSGEHVVWEGVVEEIRRDPRYAPQIVARTDEGLMFSCFAGGWEAWLSPRERLTAQIFSEAMVQLEELSDESGALIQTAEDEALATDLRESLMAALDQRYVDWLADNDLPQP